VTTTYDFVVKQHDTAPAFTATILNAAGTVVDLTGASVKFVARALTAVAPTINATATIVSAAAGTVSYTPTATDTATAGMYMVEWHITAAGGVLSTFPTDGWQNLWIEEDLVSPGGAMLVSVPEVKDHLRIPATDRSHDARLRAMINALTPVIEGITGPIVQRVYQNETYDGGNFFIALRHRPVISVQSVIEYRGPIAYVLTQVPTPDLGTIYSYMFEPPGRLVRRTVGGGITPFPAGADQVFVTYTAGFQTVPYNVREAALELVRVNYQQTEQGGRPQWGTDESVEPIAGPMLGFFIPNRVRELLSPSKRHPSVA
jgi:hypothetical protein